MLNRVRPNATQDDSQDRSHSPCELREDLLLDAGEWLALSTDYKSNQWVPTLLGVRGKYVDLIDRIVACKWICLGEVVRMTGAGADEGMV